MFLLNPQRYRSEGRRLGINETTLSRAVSTIERVHRADPRMTPIFTLRHLSELTGISYGYLRCVASRQLITYKHILLRKRVPDHRHGRFISIPSRDLLKLQQWIVQNVLQFTSPSSASFAYHPQSSPVLAAEEHRMCQWLLKIDLEDFFHNISEGRVFDIFHELGYPRLLSFELARLTTVALPEFEPVTAPESRWPAIPYYAYPSQGVLPQGAPSSPMLSNLVMRGLDDSLISLAAEYGMRYTRYADDLAFSCTDNRARSSVKEFRNRVLGELSREGFRHNKRKTVLRGPGARRIVLGMLVDGPTPRLPREKDNIRMHLHYLRSPDFGPSRHAEHRRTSISSLYHHVRGLIGWAELVEPAYGRRVLTEFKAVSWPPVRPRWLERRGA